MSDPYTMALSLQGVDLYNIFLTDLNERELEKVGKANNIENLSAAVFPARPFPVEGIIWSSNRRFMIPLVVQCLDGQDCKPINVWFLATMSSPHSCIAVKTFEMLGMKVTQNDSSGPSRPTYRVAIQGEHNSVEFKVSKDNYAEVNILGRDAMNQLNVSLDLNWKKGTIKLKEKKLLPRFKNFDKLLSKLRHKF